MFFFDALFVLTVFIAHWLCFILLAVGMHRIFQALYSYFQWKDKRHEESCRQIITHD